jgi:hypothetical protein
MVQVFFSGQMSDAEVLAKFESAAALFRAILNRYDQVPEQALEPMRQIPSPREHYFWMLTLDLGLRTMRANLEWAESVIAAIRNRQIPTQ